MTANLFKKIFYPMKDRLFRYALAFLHDHDEAMDAVQEIYLKLWKGREGWGEYKSKEALAVRMMRNYCLDKLKSAESRKRSSQEVPEIPLQQNPYNITANKESEGILNQLLSTLPEIQSELVHLRDVEQYDYDEITEITGFNVNYIRVNLSRARKKLRDEYLKIENYELAKNR